MDPRRRSLLDNSKASKNREAEKAKAARKPDGKQPEYDFSVARSLFDDDAV